MTNDDTSQDDRETNREHDHQASGYDGLDRRAFMRGAAASVAGAGAMAALSDEAAAGSGKALVVVARDAGRHDYSIRMKGGDSIRKAAMAGGNDSTGSSLEEVSGTVWDWNADSYVYTGEIDRLEADGTVSFHFPDGAFARDDRLAVAGQGNTTCHYSVGAANADLDLNEDTTEGLDSDDLGGASERTNRPDQVSGRVVDAGNDSFTLGRGDPIQYVSIEGGHAAVECYRTGRTLGGGSRGRASVVFFYMGDGPFTTFFQNFTKLTEAMVGYDRSVLLKHNNQASGVSHGAHQRADAVHAPTQGNFERCLRSLTRAGYEIDLYIVSHGDRSGFKMSTGSHGSSDYYRISDIQSFRASFDGEIPLRMVYQSNCWGCELNDAWQELGADAAAGSRYVNFFPNQFEEFALAWRTGAEFETALQLADTPGSRANVRKYLIGDMGATDTDDWNQSGQFCGYWDVLYDQGHCAREYFVDRWQHSSAEWNSVSLDGWDFVQHASEKLTGGDPTIRI
jgi:hypothetical protein